MEAVTEDRAQSASLKSAFQVEFVGDARDYFRVWIVNLCLTLLTLGVFSAWAKVRKQRYFYSHTIVDGTPFQYLGKPVPILRGRLIAVALFCVYYATQYAAPAIMPYVLSALVVLGPWVIMRSSAFRARYTAFRNMTFGFHGTYSGAAHAIYWLGGIPFLVVGFMFEWWGDYRILGGASVAAGFLFPWWLRGIKHFIVSNMSFGERRASFNATGGQYFTIYFLSGLIIGVGGALTGATIALLPSHSQEYVIAALIPIYFFYVVAIAYVRARTGNLIWNSSKIDGISFRSTLSTGGLLGLYLVNALGIIVSLGMLTPWAVMRTMRYRAQQMTVVVNGSLEHFRGSQSSAVSAAGAEMGEMFDLEFSL